MEIAAVPGRRPAPAAGRAGGVVDDRFETTWLPAMNEQEIEHDQDSTKVAIVTSGQE
jgi:hypothetical protein